MATESIKQEIFLGADLGGGVGFCTSWKGDFSSLTESSKLPSLGLNSIKENHFNWKLRFEIGAQAKKKALLWSVI